jgi:hypothetical protein
VTVSVQPENFQEQEPLIDSILDSLKFEK